MEQAKKQLANINFGGKTSMVLIATGTVLGAIYGMGENLGIKPEYLEYLKVGLTFLGYATGITFISLDKKKLKKNLERVGIPKKGEEVRKD